MRSCSNPGRVEPYPGRVFTLAPAWFATYRPRLGLADDLGALVDDADTALAVFALPALPALAASTRWIDGRIDAAATLPALGFGMPKKLINS